MERELEQGIGFGDCFRITFGMSRRRLILLVCCWSLVASDLWACSVPVFRYALERWAPDTYNVFVFHEGPLSEDQQGLVDRLNSNGSSASQDSNLSLTRIDVSKTAEPEALALWEAQGTENLPWMMVSFPWKRFAADSVWSGPFTESAVERLLDSPVRREVARRLLRGDSAVWVLLECGDSEKDKKALERLNSRLNHLESRLELPVLNPEDIEEGLITIDEDQLKIAFSSLRLSREDPKETFFVRNLLGSEDDLAGFDEPIAFPIFGRGRVLYGLIGEGIASDVIDEASLFLTGACSCEVKEQNPGVDLLMSVDWDRLITTQYEIDRELPPLAGFVGMNERASMAAPEGNVEASGPDGVTPDLTDKFPVSSSPTSSQEKDGLEPVLLNTVLICSVVGLGALGAGIVLLRRRPRVD